MARPDSEFYDDVSRGIAAHALRTLLEELERRNLLPFGEEVKALALQEIANAVRNGISNLAQIQSEGADIGGAIFHRPDDTQNPPSPV